jgi:hypothetical protein
MRTKEYYIQFIARINVTAIDLGVRVGSPFPKTTL